MYQPGEDMPMSPGYPGGAYYPPANMYHHLPYGPAAGMGYMGPPPHGLMMPPPPGYEHPQQQQQQGYPPQQQQQQGAGGEGQDDQLAPPPPPQQQQQPVAQGEGNGTIPPAEVSKSIPCKFFPNCRYGAQCAFQHPVQPPPHAFSPPPMPMYGGYEQGPPYPPAFYPMGPPFGYSSPPPPTMGMAPPPPPPPPMHSVSPPPQQQQQQSYPPPPPATTVDYSNDAAFIVNPQNQGMPAFMPSAMAPPFAPAFQPQAAAAVPAPTESSDAPQGETTDGAPTAAVPAVPAAHKAEEQQQQPAKPQHPANQQQQQQQQQQHGKNFPRKFGPFGGAGAYPPAGSNGNGGKKFGPKAGGAKWVGGNAPPCSFFLSNNCRNGDMCRFPHLNAEGIDCRNPGVIDGSIPSAPISVLPGKPARAAYATGANTNGGGAFPLSSKAMQHSAASKVASRAAAATTAAAAAGAAPGETAAEDGTAAAVAHVPSAATPAFVPGRVHPNPSAAARPFAQARSQPGSRPLSPTTVHGGPSRNPRSLSAAPSAAGGAAARRKDEVSGLAGKDAGAGAGGLSAAALARQRVPSSDDFPALGGSVGSLKESTSSLAGSVVVVPSSAGVAASAAAPAPAAGKTAAQVLSAPAPAGANPSYVKPAPKKPAAAAAASAGKQAEDDKERQASKSSDDGASSSSSGKTSDSEDAVLVDAAKSAPSAPNGAPSPLPTPAVKKIPSFAAATMVGAIKA